MAERVTVEAICFRSVTDYVETLLRNAAEDWTGRVPRPHSDRDSPTWGQGMRKRHATVLRCSSSDNNRLQGKGRRRLSY